MHSDLSNILKRCFLKMIYFDKENFTRLHASMRRKHGDKILPALTNHLLSLIEKEKVHGVVVTDDYFAICTPEGVESTFEFLLTHKNNNDCDDTDYSYDIALLFQHSVFITSLPKLISIYVRSGEINMFTLDALTEGFIKFIRNSVEEYRQSKLILAALTGNIVALNNGTEFTNFCEQTNILNRKVLGEPLANVLESETNISVLELRLKKKK